MRRSTFLTTIALLLGAGSTALANDSYVRFQDNPNASRSGALQTAVGTFTHPDSKVKVILYGVVHIADADYYRAVQKDLDSYTTVLYEGVAPGKTKVKAEDKGVFQMQKLMGEVLGLTFQKDGIDYKRKNLVHADMTIDELKKRMGGGPINPMGNMFPPGMLKNMGPMMKSAMGFMKAMPGMQDMLKMQLGRQLGNADLSTAMPGKMGKVILIDRNEVAYGVLRQQLPKHKDGTIAIFYGAAHNPDLQKRLEADGWSLESKRWMSAWKVGKGVGNADSVETPDATPVRPHTNTPKKKSSGPEWF